VHFIAVGGFSFTISSYQHYWCHRHWS
jgi:hypothetical protein